jgi:Chaperone of endosialidase
MYSRILQLFAVNTPRSNCLMQKGLVALVLALAFFALASPAQAVTPAPDGGYPNGNTAEGTNALFSLTNGFANTALGFQALYNNTTSDYNTGVGYNALVNNTAGTQNTALGVSALVSNLKGNFNTAIGVNALFSNTTENIGFEISGERNTATGVNALFSNTTGTSNTAMGVNALYSNINGGSNTAVGDEALFNNAGTGDNTAVGYVALHDNRGGFDNTAVGSFALEGNTTGFANTAVGRSALLGANTGNTGDNNTAIGRSALQNTSSGNSNTAVGNSALGTNSSGSNNVALGQSAGVNLTTGGNNIVIGAGVLGAAGESGKIRIGKQGTQNSAFIAGIYNVSEGGTIKPVYINSTGRLGTQPPASSRRFKTKIKPMDKASEAILALKPVTFHYKKEVDPEGIPQFGLVAEQVEKVNPDLVARDADGKVNTVRYEAVNAMLLNEFLKEHRTVQELKTTVAQQEKQIETLTAGLQKVSAQLEVSKPAPQTAMDNQ